MDFPEIKVNMNVFSASVDHRNMRGMSLELRKDLNVNSASIYESIIELPIDIPKYDDDIYSFFAGVHTLEHCLAYAGGIRDSIFEKNNKYKKEYILDISPYLNQNRLCFKIISLINFEKEFLFEIFVKVLNNTLKYLTNKSNSIPFATPEECGQYKFHSRDEAIKIILNSLESQFDINIQIKMIFSKITTVKVFDLRLIKPQISELETPKDFLYPLDSFKISILLEEYLKEKGIFACIGTYGCMTGMYLIYFGELEQKELENKIFNAIKHIDKNFYEYIKNKCLSEKK